MVEKPHRWAVLVTVALPDDELPDIRKGDGLAVSLGLPHAVSRPLCYDCGERLSSSPSDACSKPERPGYPAEQSDEESDWVTPLVFANDPPKT